MKRVNIKRGALFFVFMLGMIGGWVHTIESQRGMRGAGPRGSGRRSRRYAGLRPRSRKDVRPRSVGGRRYRRGSGDRTFGYYKHGYPAYYYQYSYTGAYYNPHAGAHYGLHGRRGGSNFAFGF